jgi:hypothetical protein
MSCILRQEGQAAPYPRIRITKVQGPGGNLAYHRVPEVTVWKRDPDSSHRNDTSNFISYPFLQYLGE